MRGTLLLHLSRAALVATAALGAVSGAARAAVAEPAPTPLVHGVADSGRYGFRWSGAELRRNRVEFAFEAAAGVPLAVAVRGYDIDARDEVRVVLNGEPIGYLSRGVSDRPNAVRDVFALPSARLRSDEPNSLVFEQHRTDGWIWGVTDLVIDSEDAEPLARPLIVGVPDRRRFGLRFPHADERFRSASYAFAGGTEPLIVSARGFDIDVDDEVEVYLNGERLGYLTTGADRRIHPIPSEFRVDVADQRAINTLTFVQTRTTGWSWGVTDVLVEPLAEPMLGAAVPVGAAPSSGAYGWNYPGADAYLDFVELAVESDATNDIELLVRGFDVDDAREIYVSVGSTLLGYLDRGRDGALSETSTRFVIPAALQSSDETTVTVGQALRVGYTWGVTDISATPIDRSPDPADLADDTLTLDVPSVATYGWQWSGARQAESEVSLYLGTSEADLEGLDGIDIELTGFDIDHDEEVEVLLNGVSLGFLYPTLDGEVSDCHDAFFVPVSALSEHNYLVVRQVGAAGERWGVQDVSVLGRHSM